MRGRQHFSRRDESESIEGVRQIRKVFSKLTGENLVQGVTIWVVSLLRYSAAFIS